MSHRRVVVTGMGAITPLGLSVRESWDRLIAGHSAITISGEYNLPVARVREFNWNSSFSAQEADAAGENKRYSSAPLSLFIQYAMASAQMALQDANIDYSSSSTVNRDRFGVSIGSGIGGIEEAVTAVRRLDRQQNLSPFFVPRLLNNMAAGNVSIRFGLRGPNHSLATACAAGAHSIGDAGRMIQQGDADIMLAGGTEACIGPLAIAGFSRAKALSTAKHPQACRPFDVDRDGFVIAEGAGVLVLEELEHARQRKAPKIYAELIGYGLSGDGHHITAPPDDGSGAARCMMNALRSANLQPEQIGYINAHATSTPLGDRAELRAIKSIFGKHAYQGLAISSTKSSIGHLLGAAGAVEAIFSILAINQKIIPPTLNLHRPDKESAGLDCVPLKAKPAPDLWAALSNSFGFGGTNASLIFREFK